jgi:Family of unknown function (DUF6314)
MAHVGVYPVTDLAGYFAGRWLMERDLYDADGPAGTVAGSAEFTVDGESLRYREQGVLDTGSYRGPVTRALEYRLRGPGQASVHFDHGGFFHDVDLREGRWSSAHPCADDRYRGEYRILGPNSWRLEWSVTGPKKDNVYVTRFRR